MTTQFSTPVVTSMQVIPVAGHDSMLMNLSGAHAPYFTRNIVIIKDNSGHTGVGEIPWRRENPPDPGGCRGAGCRQNSRRIQKRAGRGFASSLPTAMPAAAVCKPLTCVPLFMW
ncbi:Glucarate dehydratase [Raoultella terrigena]|uniref:Glucarate dehydratase n=1 Tax=Raoultella terrigena TaxID=577 RepID=A0A4U9D114_RAOTE|nr:Glucarate dehydratase [Raoultella terrigena]